MVPTVGMWGELVQTEVEMRSHTILGMVKLKSALTLRGMSSWAGSRHLQSSNGQSITAVVI